MPNYLIRIKFIIFLAVLSLLLFTAPNLGLCDGELEIIRWVADQLQIQKAYDIPLIKVVDKSTLNRIFASGSQGVMRRWVSDHGRADADKIMNVYLESAVGLFDPKTHTIYVSNLLPTCRQKAILAHEVTHFFQYVIRGSIVGGGMAAEMLLMEREIEACTMERSYEDRFCHDAIVALDASGLYANESIYLP